MKLMPPSSAVSMMRSDSSSGVGLPKFIAPRQSGDTCTPVRPRLRYAMGSSSLLIFTLRYALSSYTASADSWQPPSIRPFALLEAALDVPALADHPRWCPLRQESDTRRNRGAPSRATPFTPLIFSDLASS